MSPRLGQDRRSASRSSGAGSRCAARVQEPIASNGTGSRENVDAVATRAELAITAAFMDTAAELSGSTTFVEKRLQEVFHQKLSARLEAAQTGCNVHTGELSIT